MDSPGHIPCSVVPSWSDPAPASTLQAWGGPSSPWPCGWDVPIVIFRGLHFAHMILYRIPSTGSWVMVDWDPPISQVIYTCLVQSKNETPLVCRRSLSTRRCFTASVYGNKLEFFTLLLTLLKLYIPFRVTDRFYGQLAHNMLIYCQEIIWMSLNLTKCEDLYFECVYTRNKIYFFQKSILLFAFNLFHFN